MSLLSAFAVPSRICRSRPHSPRAANNSVGFTVAAGEDEDTEDGVGMKDGVVKDEDVAARNGEGRAVFEQARWPR